MRFSPQIIEHFTNPQHAGALPDADVVAYVGNPVCGDQIHLYAKISNQIVTDASFLAYGCSAALATASIIATAICGQHLDALARLDETTVSTLAGGFMPNQWHCATLGCDVVHMLVRTYRSRSTQPAPDQAAFER